MGVECASAAGIFAAQSATLGGNSFCVTAGIKGPLFLLPFPPRYHAIFGGGKKKGKREIGTVVGFPLYSAVFSFLYIPVCGKWDSDLFPICALLRYTEEDQINAPRRKRVLQEREILFPHPPPHLDPL